VSRLTATRRIQFCAGHRVLGHEGKCRHMHGHNYVVLFTAKGRHGGLDDVGRVIDFSVLKERLGGWIDDHWDHSFIYGRQDTEVFNALAEVDGQHSYELPYNPTAENMAYYLLTVIGPMVLEGTGVALTSVRVWETENCYAEAS
jgi:6-pyruvoyltetrahydropterin/6-carboxytetrahydropterin synthase